MVRQRRIGRPRNLSDGDTMRYLKWLALVPFIGMLGGPFFVNRVTPFVLGMPFLLAWIVLWVVLTSAIMALIYRLDPENRREGPR